MIADGGWFEGHIPPAAEAGIGFAAVTAGLKRLRKKWILPSLSP
jgi:hypothetical protein